MGATQKFQLVVEAQARGEAELARLSATVNKLSTELERANKKIAEDAVKSQVRYSSAVSKMRTDAEAAFGGANRTIGESSSAFSGYAKGALGAYAAIKTVSSGFDAFVRGAGEAALEIKSLALSTGLTTSQADKLRAAANLTGFDIRNLKEAALDLSVALKDTGGQGQQTRDLLKQLGVSAYTSTGQTRNLNDVLLETFDALSKVQDTTQRVNLSRVLGGEDAAKNVQPLLAGYREANQLAEQLGFGTRDGLLKALDDSNKQLRAFDLQWEVIKGKLAEKIAPVVVPLLLSISKAASGDGGDLSDYLAPGARRLGTAIRQSAGSYLSGDETVGINQDERISGDARGLLSIRDPKVPAGLTDFSTATQLGARFRSGQGGTEDGFKLRLEQIGKNRAGLVAALSSGELTESAFNDTSKKLARLTAEQIAIGRQLAQLAKARAGEELTINSADLVDVNIGRTLITRKVPSLRGNASSLPDLPEFVSTQADRDAFDSSNPAADQAAARSESQRQVDQRERELNTSFDRQSVQFQERKIELLTGPGGELDAINRIYDLKKAGLEQELQYGAEIFDLTQRRQQIEEERTLRILDLRRQQRDEARDLASDFVGSLQAGSPRNFFQQQGGRLINQIGTNALQGGFERAQGVLGQIGASSGLGGLLKGTLLDPQNATPVDKNTAATDRNTAAIERLTVGAGLRAGGVSVPGAGVPIPGFPGIFASDITGITGRGPLFDQPAKPTGIVANFTAGLESIFTPRLHSASTPSPRVASGEVTPSPGFIGLGTDEAGEVQPMAANSASRGAVAVGIAGAGVAGAYGVISGIRKGGVAGAIDATGAGAGAAASILALSGVTGPAAPILAGVAIGAMVAKSFLPDPKKARDRQIDERLNAAVYTESAPMTYNLDRLGRGTDTNRRGDTRPIVINQNFTAFDGKSIMDRRDDLADAFRQAIYEGHGVNRAMQEAVMGA